MSDKKLFSYSRERFDVKANIIHSSRQPRYTGYSLPRSSSHQHRVYGVGAWSWFCSGFYTGEQSLHRYFS